MPIAEFIVKVPVKIKKKANVHISSCPVLDVYSQGNTEAEAKRNLAEALRLFLVSCLERGTLDAVLKECGFKLVKKTVHAPKDQNYVSIPIPFNVSGGCAVACHA